MLFNKLYAALFLYITSAVGVWANLPELSSINPIEFDEVTQKLVASNEATFDFQNIRLKADVITYYKNYNLLNARGNINFVSENHRLLSDDFALNVESKTFSISNIKYGGWPYYVTAKSGGGTEDKIRFNHGILYYGDPHPLSPNLKAEIVTIANDTDDKEIIFKNTFLRIGKVPIFYFPKIKYNLGSNPYLLDTRVGHDGEYGSYLQTLSLFPIYDWLRVGLNLDYYSNRGTLWGPTVQYYKAGENTLISGAISSGYISDKGTTGVDIANQAIDKERDFLLAQKKIIHKNKLFVTLQTNHLSDSEVTRDFKEKLYTENQFPLNFFEASYITNNFGLSTFAHFENDNFSQTRERLPELSFNYFPHQIFQSPLFHYANITYAQIEESSIDPSVYNQISSLKYDVLDVNYGIYDNYNYKKWLKISPKLEYRGFQYSTNLSSNDSSLDPYNQNYNFILYGLEISSQYQAVYPTRNRLWKIKELRHLFKPSLSFNRINSSDSNSLNAYKPTELSPTFLFSRPSTSLIDYRNPDQINTLSLTRLSLNNYFQTKLDSYGSRNIMELHLISDFYHRYENRNPNDTVSEKNALWIEFKINPAPWLKFEMASRLKSQSLSLVENYSRLVLKSSLFWELGLSSYFKKEYADQISLDYLYKLDENTHFTSILWADLKNDTISRFKLGIHRISNTNWRTTYSINYRKDQRRDEDLSFDIGLELIAY